MTKHELATTIGKAVKEYYGLDDGADLAFNLLEAGTISLALSVDEAARIVAQHITQA